MRISKKLSIIIMLTVAEVSITIWAAFQISKGAGFHQLNLFHLKYAAQYENVIGEIEEGGEVKLSELKEVIEKIREQPTACLERTGFLDKKIMESIDTDYALDICESDIEVAITALDALDEYKKQKLNRLELIAILKETLDEFHEHSANFEKPISKTVDFVFKTMIPMVLFISLFNIIFITYLSRTITGSIKSVVKLLSTKNLNEDIELSISKSVSGELLELLEISRKRVKEDILNIETSKELKDIVNKQTNNLKMANEELNQFAYRTSHDLKAPLITVKGLARAIQEDIKDEDYEEIERNSARIEEHVIKLENLIIDILNLAKADLQDVNNEKIELEEITKNIKEKLEKIYIDNDVRVEMDFTHSCDFFAPKARITQIFENLISNGIKYCDKEKQNRFVKISSSEEGESLVIFVEDNGLGIPSKFNDRVFEMFQRFHQNTSFGSGLGMHIIKKHLDKMNAQIAFESSSKGTKFKISFKKLT